MTKKQKKERNKIIIAAGVFLLTFVVSKLVSLPWWGEALLFLPAYLLSGFDVLKSAAQNIGHGQIFDEKFLMAAATVGALCIAEYPEAVFVMLFFRVGELFEKVAVGKSRKSITALMDIRPDSARIEKDGEWITVDPSEVAVGDIITVYPGEKIPLDGSVTDGNSAVDTSALTGESLPRDAAPGQEVIGGCVNLSGVLQIRVSRPYGQSTVAKMLELVENSSMHKAKTESFITRFARVYTPAVVIGAVCLAVLPPLFVGGWAEWVRRALIFLVVSCPCALVISIPLTFFGGIGGAGKMGVLVKGADFLEKLSDIDTVIFDKTGTLTKGDFAVGEVFPVGVTKNELLYYAASAEAVSPHPIAGAICAAADRRGVAADTEEIAGLGISATVDGKKVLVGNRRLMEKSSVPYEPVDAVGTAVYVAADGKYVGCIVVSDRIKESAAATIRMLKKSGLKTVMLTGDRQAVGQSVAQTLGMDEVYTELLPQDKVSITERLMQNGAHTAFVGDGINDAPVLAMADIGIAMGALGSDAAIEAADIVIMDDDPAKIPKAVAHSRRTRKIVRQNILLALGIKLLVLALAAFGFADMWMASFADVGVSVLAILNAARALYIKKE